MSPEMNADFTDAFYGQLEEMQAERDRKEIAAIERVDRNARILNAALLGPRLWSSFERS